MTEIKLVCQVPSSSSDAVAALKALVKVLSLDNGSNNSAVVFEESAAAGPALVITAVNPLSATTVTKTNAGVSWMGVAKGMCQQKPYANMWGNGSPESAAQVEAWMELAITTLVPIVENEKNHELFVKAIQDYCAVVEKGLKDGDKPYLIGQVPTAADVCSSVWLVLACAKVDGNQKLPDLCSKWCSSLLSHDLLQEYVVEGAIEGIGGGATATAAAASGNAVLAKLQELNIDYTLYDHKLSMTAEELVTNVPVPDQETHTKNLFFKDKKHGLFLVTIATKNNIDTKTLGKDKLGLTGKVNLRLADAEILDQYLQVKPGCVGPLSIVNDTSKEVQLVLDEDLMKVSKIHSHPLRNDQSVSMTPSALMDYLSKLGIEPIMVSFDGGASGAASATTTAPPKVEKKAPKKDKKPASTAAAAQAEKKGTKKGETLLALQWKKEENFAQWYSDVIVLSEMISYYDISGCYILRPWSYKIWELIQLWFNQKIQELGVENSYFPLFVSKDRLEKEKDHVEGFAPEVAWVTKSGDGELAKPIAVRPTSETIMYPAFSDWIKSHRDLPLKLNQWSNVVRWEFKYPTPFLRSREFLWQEGHTAHVSFEDADKMVQEALDLYRGVYEDLLAVPVVKGYKTEKEKFAGGYQTTTVEAYIPIAGRAIQGATSHNLGQNFGKMFDINFQDESGKTQIAWQTSWGLTTRTIGVMIMVHGDDTGLVLPPRVSPLQAVIVPIYSKKMTAETANPYCEAILKDLEQAGIRAKFDDRTMYNPGWKYNHWEQKGVPLRVEVGPRDVEQKSARIVVRYNGDKLDMAVDGLGEALVTKLEEIQQAMLAKALAKRDEHLVKVTDWKDFVPNLEKHNLVLTPWCGGEHQDWEEWVKEKSREESLKARGEEEEDTRTSTSVAAKTLCIPFDQPELPAGTKCIASGMDAKCWVLWGRSY